MLLYNGSSRCAFRFPHKQHRQDVKSQHPLRYFIKHHLFNSSATFTLLRKSILNECSTIKPCFFETPFLIRSVSSNSTSQNSFTVSYLIDSCGLSQEKAISASEKVQFETCTKPDSVLTLLRSNKFPNTHISKIIEKHPSLLLCNVDKTLKSKLDFFNSKGLSGPDLAEALSVNPVVLRASLEKSVIPAFDFLKNIFQTETNFIVLHQNLMLILHVDPQKHLAPNIALLRTHGVPETNIRKFLVSQPTSFMKSTASFNEMVDMVKKMNFDPSTFLFLRAIQGVASLSKSNWEAKIDVYKRWGWSDDEIQCAFRKTPQVMMTSEKKIELCMDFLVNTMGYDRVVVTKQPRILHYSFERRIFPRCSVIQVLTSNGLIKTNDNVGKLMEMTESDFLEKYVTNFEDKVPELVNVYQRIGR